MADKIEEEPLTPTEVRSNGDRNKNIIRTIIIVAPIIIVLIGSLYFFFFIILGPKHNDIEQIQQSKHKNHVVLESNTYLDMDPIIIGLSPSGTKKEYLRINITLRLSTEEESNVVIKKLPVIKDTLIIFLRSLRATDFNSSSSAIYLKEEISKRINKITAPVIIKEVLFQELIVN